MASLFAEEGLHLDLPCLDDRVVEAVLSVRVHERGTPWRNKALLSEAMRGTLLASVRHRAELHPRGHYRPLLRIAPMTNGHSDTGG